MWDWVTDIWDSEDETPSESSTPDSSSDESSGFGEWFSNNAGGILGSIVGGSTQDQTGSSDTAEPIQPPINSPQKINYWLVGGVGLLVLIVLILLFRGK